MSIKTRIKSIIGLETKSAPVPYDVNMVWLNSLSLKKDLDYYKDWAFACIRLISESIANIDWNLFKVKGEVVEEELDHPLLSLLYHFNDKFTKFASIKLSVIYLLLQGRSPWILIGDNKPKEIWVVPPNNLSVSEKDSAGYPTMYKYKVGSNEISIPADNVLDLRSPHPENPTTGKSVISAIKDTLDTDEQMTRWNKRLMYNSARPSGTIQTDKILKPEEIKLLKKMIEENYAGAENSNKVMLLQNGLEFKADTMVPKDLEFTEGKKENRDKILSMFGVPKILLGLEGSYNRATAEIAERVFDKYTIEPIVQMIIEQLNQFLVPRFGTDILLGFTPFVKENMELKLKEWEKGWNKWLTTNEIREYNNKESLDGGDDIYLPINLMPGMTGEKGFKTKKISKKGNNIKTITNKDKIKTILRKLNARNNTIKRTGDELGKIFEQKLKDKRKVVLKLKDEKEDVKLKWWNKSIELKRKIDDGWSYEIREILENQKDIILNNLKKYKKGLDKIELKELVEEVMFNKNEQIKATIEIIEPKYYASIMAGSQTSAMITGNQVIDLAENPAVQKWVKKISNKYAEEITETTYTRFSGVLQEGIEAGESTYGLGNRVEDYFKNTTPARADLIARTESARAMTSAEAYAYGEYGYTELEWYMGGQAPCEICQANSMRTWTIEEAKNGTINYAHPQCECLFLPIK